MRGLTAGWAPAVGRLALVIVVATSCSGGSGTKASRPKASANNAAGRVYAVGGSNEVFVDTRRSTAANGSVPAHPGRSLPTLIFYPAAGPAGTGVTPNARPDRAHGPYPLIVFAHGLGSSGAEYQGLLRAWAAAGFVVAAPRFPLTNRATAGGFAPGDYVNQPADMSYVITAVLRAAAARTGLLAGLVDPRAIGAAGHSLGGITTLGLAANTCCHDAQIEAAVVMSGDTLTFPRGRFDYAPAPPILFVHGSADALVPYESSIDAFNRARGPKGLLTVVGGDHGATVSESGKAFASVVRTTTDFFDAYLEGDTLATKRLTGDSVAGITRVVFDSQAGSRTTVPTVPTTPGRVHHASASAVAGLTNGEPVTVQWSNFAPGKTVNIVECSEQATADAGACDLKHGALLQPDPTGSGHATIRIVVGTVGTGRCDAAHHDCVIVVNDGGSLDPTQSVRIPIEFAPASR